MPERSAHHERYRGDSETLVIRPHHLSHFYGFVQNYKQLGDASIDILEREYRASARGEISRINGPLPVFGLAKRIKERRQRNYLEDVLGNTFATADEHVDQLIQLNRDFMRGDDKTPVRIALEKDRICLETCAIGDHCDIMYVANELDMMNQFLEMVGATDTADQIDFDENNNIITTIGGLKLVFSRHLAKSQSARSI